jgi:hypothetical protein
MRCYIIIFAAGISRPNQSFMIVSNIHNTSKKVYLRVGGAGRNSAGQLTVSIVAHNEGDYPDPRGGRNNQHSSIMTSCCVIHQAVCDRDLARQLCYVEAFKPF